MFKPQFTITPSINNRIAEIEKYKTLVDQATILPELELQLRFRATVESVHSSTSIEGNPLNRQQVEKILHGNTITASDYAITEVLNYKRAIDWLEKQQVLHVLNPKQILKLHRILMGGLLPNEKVGVWRPGPVYIVDEIDGKEVVQYTGHKAGDLPKLVGNFVKWVSLQIKQESYHPVLLAGLVHFIFVSIHPFSDGNGRSTRLLTYQYLQSAHYDFRRSLSLDSFYLQNRKAYFKVLGRGKTFDDRMQGDLTEFIDFFTKGFLQSVKNISHYIKVGKAAESDGKPLRLSAEELRILDYVYEFGSITIREATEVVSTTKRTAQRRLNDLVQNSILRIEGKGPATRYLLRTN